MERILIKRIKKEYPPRKGIKKFTYSLILEMREKEVSEK